LDNFSISQLSRFSGIKPHTIRIWEQRYDALRPNRSEGNTRFYDNNQLRRLLNIVSLMKPGYKVSELCAMSDKELFALVGQLPNSPSAESTEYLVSQLIAAAVTYDELHFEKIFSHCLSKYGIKDAYLHVIHPLLTRMGLMWTSDALPACGEHFISNLLRQKLCTSIDSLPPPRGNAETWILFLPENEFHELGLLYAHYLIRLSGRKVVYLGANVPLKSVMTVSKVVKAAYLLLFLVHQETEVQLQEYFKALLTGFKGRKIFVAADAELIEKIEQRTKVSPLAAVQDLEKMLWA
jgi:DNA-binding transcriptional MerR regulator